MTEQSPQAEEGAVQGTEVAVPAKTGSSAPPPKKSRTGPLAVAVTMTMVLSLVAIAGAGYLWLTFEQQRTRLEASRADLAGATQRVDSQAQQLRELQRQLDQLSSAAQQREQTLQQGLETVQRQLASQQKRLHSLSTTDRADWLLAEAEYLIRLANQRLLMGEEVAGALDLLKAADDIMVELDDAALFPVRKALAVDIAALRTAGKFDLEGTYLQLEAAARQGDQLTLFEMPRLQLPKAEAAQPEGWQQRLESGLAGAWQKLKGYIQIKRRDKVYKPLLAPEYEAAARQNLRLMFEQAQMAALAGKQRLYEDSLAKAQYWLNTYYTLDKSASQALVATIKTLEKQQVEIQLPDISGSLRALKAYIEAVHEMTPAPPATQAADNADTEAVDNTATETPAETNP